MFKSKTVFVVGAGASTDLNFPSGLQLRDEIADELRLVGRTDFGRAEGPYRIMEALRTKANQDEEANSIRHYVKAARIIAANLPMVRSIDEFIDLHAGDKYIEFVAKVAICARILSAESESWLLTGQRNERKLDWSRLEEEDAWLRQLWFMLGNQARFAAPRDVFENVGFVVFNYDRCVEVFLTEVLVSLFSATRGEAQQIVESIQIVHPYGRVGNLEGVTGGVEFGEAERVNLAQLAGNIRTFGESERDEAQSRRIAKMLDEATNVAILGFAFHDQNMDFFASNSLGDYPKVYATAYKLPTENLPEIAAALSRQIRRPNISPLDFPTTFRDCKGAELLRVFEKPLTR